MAFQAQAVHLVRKAALGLVALVVRVVAPVSVSAVHQAHLALKVALERAVPAVALASDLAVPVVRQA